MDWIIYTFSAIGFVVVAFVVVHVLRGAWLAHKGIPHPPRGKSVWKL